MVGWGAITLCPGPQVTLGLLPPAPGPVRWDVTTKKLFLSHCSLRLKVRPGRCGAGLCGFWDAQGGWPGSGKEPPVVSSGGSCAPMGEGDTMGQQT